MKNKSRRACTQAGKTGNALTLTVTENTDIARLLENAQSAMAKEWAKG